MYGKIGSWYDDSWVNISFDGGVRKKREKGKNFRDKWVQEKKSFRAGFELSFLPFLSFALQLFSNLELLL